METVAEITNKLYPRRLIIVEVRVSFVSLYYSNRWKVQPFYHLRRMQRKESLKLKKTICFPFALVCVNCVSNLRQSLQNPARDDCFDVPENKNTDERIYIAFKYLNVDPITDSKRWRLFPSTGLALCDRNTLSSFSSFRASTKPGNVN
jgi:hypothetical protein